MRYVFSVAVISIITLSFIFSPTFATVNTGWDWHQVEGNDKTTIHYCLEDVDADDGLPNGTDWKEQLDAAAENWNNAGTGWTFEPTNQGQDNEGESDASCQLEIRLTNHNAQGGAFMDGAGPPFCDSSAWPSTDRTSKVYICIDPTPTSNQPPFGQTSWNTSGNDAFDPEVVLKHEMSHAIRITHPTTADGHRTSPIPPGDHNATLTEYDKQEASDSVNRTKTGISTNSSSVGATGGNISVPYPVFDSEIGFRAPPSQLSIPAEALETEETVSLRSMFGLAIPDRENVPPGSCPISWALKVNSNPTELFIPATVQMHYEDHVLMDPEITGVLGSKGEHTISVYSIQPESESPNTWQILDTTTTEAEEGDNISIDTKNNKITFPINNLGSQFYGLAAQCEKFEQTSIPVNNYDFPIVLTTTSSTLPQASLSSDSLIITLNTSEEGLISLNLPSGLIDAMKNDGVDNPLFVMIDGEEARAIDKPYRDGDGNTGRTILVNYAEGSSTIEVMDPIITVPEKKQVMKEKEAEEEETSSAMEKKTIASPLKQVMQEGIEPADVKCKTGFQLLLKSSNNMPACVTSLALEKLVERNWGVVP